MSKFLVSGTINVETTLKVDSFPIEYSPVNYKFWDIKTNPAGVGLNILTSLKMLGNDVTFVSMIGNDVNGQIVKRTCEDLGVDTKYIISNLRETPQSVVIFDNNGNRQINTDLKDIVEIQYPQNQFDELINKCEIFVLTNVNFSRYFLQKVKDAGKLIATDVHELSNLDDKYNKDFLEYADILFLSHENIKGSHTEFMEEISRKFDNKIVVMGMGSEGALLFVRQDNFIRHTPAYSIREVVNTVGAGDALFSSFLHFYTKEKNVYIALKKAMLYASYKIGENGSTQGLISAEEFVKISEHIEFE